MRRPVRLLAVPLVLVLLVAALGEGLVLWNLPSRGASRLPGLSAPVKATFDERGVATVEAASAEDAIRAQGFLTARERMFQLELLRRTARGELAELFGPAALPLDRRHRTYGFGRVADAAVPLLPARERADLEALSAGINAFLLERRGRLGLEFTLLRTAPEPWRPGDSLAVLLLMYEQLTSTWESERDAARLAGLPESLRAFLLPRATRDDVTLVPDSGPPPVPALPDLAGWRPSPAGPWRRGKAEAGASLVPWTDDAPRVASTSGSDSDDGDDDRSEVLGSNAFAVAGALSASGKPLLASDPHLGLEMPGIWLPMRFRVAGRLAEGVTLPGIPALVIGRTEELAWGLTNLMADVQDLYAETFRDGKVVRGGALEEVGTRVEAIPVRGRAPFRLTVRTTSRGPLVDGNLALAWTALDPRNLRLPTGDLLRARSADAALAVFDEFTGPPQNVVWASASGSIGWRPAGLLPVRRPGTDGSVPYDGSDPANGWSGLVPSSELPRVVDPPSGIVVTANQRVFGTSYPRVVATDWGSPTRARRIRDLLEAARRAERKLGRDDLEAIQLDVVSEPLRLFALPFRPFLPADVASALAAWDGGADAASSSFLVARTLRKNLRKAAAEAWGVVPPRHLLDEESWNDLVAADGAAWERAGLGRKDELLARVARTTIEELSVRWGRDRSRWRWGAANRLAVRHPLGRVRGLGWLFDPPTPEQSGAPQVVRASSPSYGQSMRLVVDWGKPAAATLVVPFGVSGHVGSRNRLDQLPFWLAGDPSGKATSLSRPARGDVVTLAP